MSRLKIHGFWIIAISQTLFKIKTKFFLARKLKKIMENNTYNYWKGKLYFMLCEFWLRFSAKTIQRVGTYTDSDWLKIFNHSVSPSWEQPPNINLNNKSQWLDTQINCRQNNLISESPFSRDASIFSKIWTHKQKQKKITDNATGKNWMSKTLSLQTFVSDARQLWRISSFSQLAKKINLPTNMPRVIEQSMEQYEHKKLNVINIKYIFFSFETFFCEIIPARHITKTKW